MKNGPKHTLSRRRFVRSIARSAALGALGLLTLSLARRRRDDRGREECVNHGICCGCRALEHCRLPRALSAKQAMRRDRT